MKEHGYPVLLPPRSGLWDAKEVEEASINPLGINYWLWVWNGTHASRILGSWLDFEQAVPRPALCLQTTSAKVRRARAVIEDRWGCCELSKT